jgi:hypothetical protein
MDFKVGMKVRRIKGSFGSMKVGDIGTITEIIGNTVTLKEYGTFEHEIKNLEPLSWRAKYESRR